MAAEDIRPDFEAKRTYLIKGDLLNRLIRLILKNKPLKGNNTDTEETANGILIHASPGEAVSSATGSFLRVYTDADTGNTMLQGGTVSGGTGVITVADYVLLASGATAPEDATYVTLTISLTGNVEDDVLIPGCTVTAAVIGNFAADDNVVPTLAAPAGTLYVSLGEWGGGEFHSCGVAGNIYVQAFLGSLNPLRG